MFGLYVDKEDKLWDYCDEGCKYEDSCGFCSMSYQEKILVNGLPTDAKCYSTHWERYKEVPVSLTPDNSCDIIKVEKVYGFK